MNSTAHSALLAFVAAVLLTLGVGSGYALGQRGGDTGTPIISVAARASATAHNSTDARFAQAMIPHHAQAIVMARLAATRARSAEVKSLARTIEAAQTPEIDQMRGWLRGWGVAGSSGMSGMGDDMMSADDMAALRHESGAAFDQDFLTMMTGHHSGAVAMAEDELAHGQNAHALALAAGIQVTQQAEITQMKTLLG